MAPAIFACVGTHERVSRITSEVSVYAFFGGKRRFMAIDAIFYRVKILTC